MVALEVVIVDFLRKVVEGEVVVEVEIVSSWL